MDICDVVVRTLYLCFVAIVMISMQAGEFQCPMCRRMSNVIIPCVQPLIFLSTSPDSCPESGSGGCIADAIDYESLAGDVDLSESDSTSSFRKLFEMLFVSYNDVTATCYLILTVCVFLD